MKRKYIIFGIVLLILIVTIFIVKLYNNKENPNNPDPIIIEREYSTLDSNNTLANSYEEYINLKSKNYNIEDYNYIVDNNELSKEDFNNNKYYIINFDYNSCGENIDSYEYKIENNILKVYYSINSTCGVCAFETYISKIKVSKEEKIDKVETLYKINNKEECNPNIAYKPMIYIYPEYDMDLTIKLLNKDILTSTYPKYNNVWNIHVSKDGNIYDYNTKRNYYGLYWEALDDKVLDYKEGFVIEGKDTIKFLEEKLEILGLSEYEINEFITYWISKLENNKYNYIYFRTMDEINNYMKLEFSKEPETLIRILVDFKPLDRFINVNEQKLNKVVRKGYTIVEWGATIHNN